MALLSQYIKDKEADVRMIDRSLNKGTVSRDEVEKNQKKVQDDAENVSTVNVSELLDQVRLEKKGSPRLN